MPADLQTPQSLLNVIASALADLAAEAKAQSVDLAWTVDPSLPPYISVRRVDLFAIVSVLVRRAIGLMENQTLHLTIASNGHDGVLLQLEDLGDTRQSLDKIAWQQLEYWVEELGGKLEREQDGLMWLARLPLDRSSFDHMLTQPAAHAGLQILVVCPDTDTRSKILFEAQKSGHKAIECTTQADALVLVTKHKFHLVLIDADLGDTDGFALARSLRLGASKLLIALMSTETPTSREDFSWIKLWMHKPPRAHELQFAFNAASAERRQRVQARVSRSSTADQSESALSNGGDSTQMA